MFGTLVNVRFYHAYSLFTTCFAACSNGVLIYSIIVSNVKHVGPYRFLLIAFAIVEILISLVHFALIPGTHLTEFGCILFGYRVLSLPTEQAVWASMAWSMLFYQTFVLTAFHYVYRFVLVCNPPWLWWIQRNPWRNWISIATIYDILFVCAISFVSYEGSHPDLFRKEWAPIMMKEYKINLLAPSKPGFLAVVYWTRNKAGSKVWAMRSLICIMIIIVIFSTSVVVLVYCLMRILKELTPNSVHFNSVTRQMQKQLFRALLWQTIVPLFTSYIPVAFIFAAPLLTGIAFGGLGTVALMSTQIFPMVDPFIVLLFVQDYRKALPRFVQNFIKKTTEISMSSSSSSAVMHLTGGIMMDGSDPLIAIGPNNRTYWLMLLVRSEGIVHCKFLYYAAVLLEVTLTLVGYYLHYRGVKFFWKYKILHHNFLIIIASVYAVMLMGSLARLVTILYETKIIELPGLGYGPVPILAIIRQTSFGQAFFHLYVVTIERFCATVFVSDYERNKRIYISVILSILLTGSSAIIGYSIVTGFVSGFLVSVLALIPNIFCAIIFRLMIIHNKRRHARLTNKIKRDPNDEYSLSLRVQLNENIWSIQKIEFGLYAITAALFVNLIFVFLPMFFLVNQYELLQWFACAGNVGFAFTITATAPILEVIVAIHKGNIPSFLIRVFGKDCFGATTSIKERKNETEIYFTQLAHQWNM